MQELDTAAKMDPLSTIAGVAGISAAAMQSVKSLFDLVDSVKGATEEMRAVSRDVHAFYSIVFSLNVTLKEEDIKGVVSGDKAMVEMIGNLKKPLDNCRAVLGELMVKVQKRISVDKGPRMNMAKVKWGLFTKKEVRDLQLRLEATKSTLHSALNAVIA